MTPKFHRIRKEFNMKKIIVAFILLVAALTPINGFTAEPRQATLYKDPACGCCANYVEYLKKDGFQVTVVDTDDLAAVKAKYGVPDALAACHTVLIGGYVVEGHVPVGVIHRLLAQKPEIKGVALPGMPAGSPGMAGEKTAPLTIYVISGGAPKVFAVE
jgi:hypothetical protein